MNITREYPCPYCEDEVEIDGNELSGTCKSCGMPYKVDYDAEFIDGRWRDNTHLYKADEHNEETKETTNTSRTD